MDVHVEVGAEPERPHPQVAEPESPQGPQVAVDLPAQVVADLSAQVAGELPAQVVAEIPPQVVAELPQVRKFETCLAGFLTLTGLLSHFITIRTQSQSRHEKFYSTILQSIPRKKDIYCEVNSSPT